VEADQIGHTLAALRPAGAHGTLLRAMGLRGLQALLTVEGAPAGEIWRAVLEQGSWPHRSTRRMTCSGAGQKHCVSSAWLYAANLRRIQLPRPAIICEAL